MFTTNYQFCLFNIYSQAICLQCSFPKFYSPFQVHEGLWRSSSGHPLLVSLDNTISTMINHKGFHIEPWSYLSQEIITETLIDFNTTSNIPIHRLHNLNQTLLYSCFAQSSLHSITRFSIKNFLQIYKFSFSWNFGKLLLSWWYKRS